jgi:ferredoxin
VDEIGQKITANLLPFFDAIGTIDQCLVLGLESRPDRDLDEFTLSDGKYRFDGFGKHFSPLVAAAIKAIEAEGHTARQLRYSSEVGIKKLAVRAGLGKWGKNSLVIHPKFGPWLRFVVLETDIRFDSPEHEQWYVSPTCAHCDLCIRACPVGLVGYYALGKPEACLAYLDLAHPASTRRCEICLLACPIGTPR